MKYVHEICGCMYDEAVEGTSWVNLNSIWKCPLCTAPKECFKEVALEEDALATFKSNNATPPAIQKNAKKEDILEANVSLIHEMAIHNASRIEAMYIHKPVPGWDGILLLGGQLVYPSSTDRVDVDTTTITEKNAHRPVVPSRAAYVSHMSFGALSKRAKAALTKGTIAVHTTQYSGGDGILSDEIDHTYKYIFEYVPNKYGVTDENPERSDAIEIKIGQGSKPSMSGHPPTEKVTEEVSAVRGRLLHQDVISPSKFEGIRTKDDSRQLVTSLREHSGGRPTGAKTVAGHIETDLEWTACTQPDFVIIDSRGSVTGAPPKHLKDSSIVPTVYALARARTYMNQHHMAQELTITRGFHTSGEMIEALAMGAGAIAVASAAIMAIGCQQYRIYHSRKYPMGIATQDSELRKDFSIDKGTKCPENYPHVLRGELKSFTRISGHTCIHDLSREDPCTTSSEVSNRIGIPHC